MKRNGTIGIIAALPSELAQLLEQAKAEFLQATAEGYVCPIPPDAVPVVAD